MKRFIYIALVLGISSTAFSGPLPIEPWWERGEEGSTYQEWSFSTDNPTPLPDDVYNPYGRGPALRVTPAPGSGWIEVVDQREGVWPLSGEIDVYVPNVPELRDYKEIWVQVTWKPAGLDPPPFLPDRPVVGVDFVPFGYMEMSRFSFPEPDGWVTSVFSIYIEPNPAEEWITIKGDILVDHLLIETICVPEPATVLLFGIGGLAVFRRKGRLA